MNIAYADPPYPGCAHLYRDHADYAGEVDHERLCLLLARDYDGFILHTSAPTQWQIETYLRAAGCTDYRVMPWVKPFAAFKRNIPVAYAWEPVLVRACRKPVVSKRLTLRDWIAEGITLKRGLTGVKPEAVCRWAFEVAGCQPEDELHDLYPGTGAVARAWDAWRAELRLAI